MQYLVIFDTIFDAFWCNIWWFLMHFLLILSYTFPSTGWSWKDCPSHIWYSIWCRSIPWWYMSLWLHQGKWCNYRRSVTWRVVPWCDVTWCWVTWRDVVWRYVVCCDLTWRNMVLSDVVCCGMVWHCVVDVSWQIRQFIHIKAFKVYLWLYVTGDCALWLPISYFGTKFRSIYVWSTVY